KLSTTLFQIATNIKPSDPSSLLGQELPGFSSFGSKVIVAGEGTDYTNLAMESSPPLEDVLEDREAVLDEPSEEESDREDENKEANQSTGEKDTVFIYNTHTRKSFLPHLQNVTDPNQAHHDEVNITTDSDRIAKKLKRHYFHIQYAYTGIFFTTRAKCNGFESRAS